MQPQPHSLRARTGRAARCRPLWSAAQTVDEPAVPWPHAGWRPGWPLRRRATGVPSRVFRRMRSGAKGPATRGQDRPLAETIATEWVQQGRAWRSPDNGRKGVALPPRATAFRGGFRSGRRTSGVGDQAMGGLMTNAAGALSNCAEPMGRAVPVAPTAGARAAGTCSMAEWQMSQAEHAAAWCSWAAQLAAPPSQAGGVACAAWGSVWSPTTGGPWSDKGAAVAVCVPGCPPWACASGDGLTASECSADAASAPAGAELNAGWCECPCTAGAPAGSGGRAPAAMAVPARPRRTNTTISTK